MKRKRISQLWEVAVFCCPFYSVPSKDGADVLYIFILNEEYQN